MTRKKSILMPAAAAQRTARFSVTVDAQLLDQLREVERAAERAGLTLPVTTLVEDRLREIVRDARRELDHLGSNPADAQASAARADVGGEA